MREKLREVFFSALTFIMLLHQRQIHMLQSMEVLNAGAVVCNSGDIPEGQEGLSGKIIGRQDIVIHHSESYHGSIRETLLQRHGELKALIEDGIESFLQRGLQEIPQR